ncbi:MAG: helix-turn-helix domain-containing protein [Caldilineaceae bacterium]
MSLTEPTSFGTLLKQLRKRAGMTQVDLAAAVGYSHSYISNLELDQRLPNLQIVVQTFIPALGLQDDRQTAMQLIQQAAIARGEPLPLAQTQLAPVQPSAQAGGSNRYHRLPAPPTALIGRATAVNQLCNRLLGHSGRLLTLVGAPGIGKTQLSLAVAARLHRSFAQGVVFVPLAAVSDATVMAATIIANLTEGDATHKPPQARLIEILRHKSLLLVLDNCEQIRAARTSLR